MSETRWPLGSRFEEARGSLGVAQYHIGSWRRWHRQMALLILARHSVVFPKLRHKRRPRRRV